MNNAFPGKIRGRPVPLGLPLIAACAGIIVSLYIEISFFWIFGALFSALFAFFSIRSPKRSLQVAVCVFLTVFFIFGFRHSSRRKISKDSITYLVPADGVLTGRSGYSLRRITVKAEKFSSDGITWETSGKVAVYYDGTHPAPGSRVKIRGSFYETLFPVNPGQFDYGAYLAHEGIFATARADEIVILKESFPGSIIGKIRSRTSALIEKYFDPPYSQVLLSMFLGDPSRMPGEILQDFRNAGITHILAVSGLHAGLVLFIFYYLFSSPGISRRKALIISLAFMWIFVFVSGARPSALRAAVMMSFASAGYILGGRGNIFNGLAAAGLFILFSKPGLLFTSGFQLSFLAVFGIIYLGPVFSRYMGKALGVSTAAVVFILPVLAHSFNYVPFAAPVVNIAVIPLASLSMACIFVFLFISPVFPSAAVVYARAAEVFTGGIIGLASFVSSSGFAGAVSPSPPPAVLIGIYIILAGAGMLNAKRRAATIFIGAAVSISAIAFVNFYPLSYIAAVSGEDSPSFLVKAGRGRPVLFAGKGRVNVSDTLNLIRSKGYPGIDDIYIVHPPFSGLETVSRLAIESESRRIFYPGKVGSPLMWHDFVSEVGVDKIRKAKAGKTVSYNSWQFEFTEPYRKYLDIRDNYMQGIIRGRKSIFIYAGGEIPDEQFDAVIVMDPYRPAWDKLKRISSLIIYSGEDCPEEGINASEKGFFLRL